MKLKSIFIKIGFSERYRKICDNHADFDNRLKGVHNDLYENTLIKLGYEYKYHSKGSFYEITQSVDKFIFNMNIVLKNGLVECLLYITEKNIPINPQGRLDFLPEDLGISFERKKFNLPIYSSPEELEQTLKEVFTIFEDIKKELLKLDS